MDLLHKKTFIIPKDKHSVDEKYLNMPLSNFMTSVFQCLLIGAFNSPHLKIETIQKLKKSTKITFFISVHHKIVQEDNLVCTLDIV
jgi:hypothetical protein